jgi:vacuolar protein sorting-associated protein 13A/C
MYFSRAVTKPVVGVFDFASNVTEGTKNMNSRHHIYRDKLLTPEFSGIRNTTTVFDQTQIDRVRLPRYIPSDGVLRVSAGWSD